MARRARGWGAEGARIHRCCPRMCLAYYTLTHPEMTCLDISQSVGRAPVRGDDILPTLTEASEIWLPQLGRVLTGKEMLLVTGLPASLFARKPMQEFKQSLGKTDPDTVMASLAGNAWVAGVILAVWLAVLSEVPVAVLKSGWEPPNEDDEDEDDSQFVNSVIRIAMSATVKIEAEIEVANAKSSSSSRSGN